MVIEFGGLEVDLGWFKDAIAGRSKGPPLPYTIDVASHAPPPGYAAGTSRDGAVEIAFPRIPVAKGLLLAALALLFLGWQVFAIRAGGGLFAVICALLLAYYLVKLAVGAAVQTSWVVSDHWLLRRDALARLPAWEAEFAVDHLEIDNAQWKTGRGSTDTLWLQTPPPFCARVKLESNADEPLRLPAQPRVAPESGRDPVTANILGLGRFLAYHAHVPLEVVVRYVSEPSAD